MQLSVIVCTYNRSKLLQQCLDSLIKQTALPDTFEIIVVDNNSQDNTKSVAETFSKKYPQFTLKYLIEKEIGLSKARNTGYKNANGEYVAYIDDDAKALDNWVESILKVIQETKPKIFGGQIYPFYATEKPNWFKDEYETRTNGGENRYLKDNEFLSGSNIIILKSLLTELGGFNPSLGMKGAKQAYGEETQLQIDCRKKGIQIYYCPEIIVEHIVPENKMKVKYRLGKAYKSTTTSLNKSESGTKLIKYLNIIKKATMFILQMIIIPFRNKKLYKYWQNYLIEKLNDIYKSQK
jgi:glucosyl-dolichyl phosphate glucuronosyltransferase